MTCDGSPGNPGLERVGDDLFTCTGCPVCKPSVFEHPGLPDPQNIPWGLEHRRIGTDAHQMMEEFTPTPEETQPTPEEMAEQLGVPVQQLAGAMAAQIHMYSQQLKEIAKRFEAPVKPSRAHRRAMKFGQAGLHGNYSNQKGKRR